MATTLNDNQFFTGLSNLALFLRIYSTSTSAYQKSFVDSFATETLAYGDTKFFLYSDLPDVGDYSETSSLLTVTKTAKTGKDSLSISQKKVVKSSYSVEILNMAFSDEAGMNMFVGYIVGQMESAKDDYIYNDIISDIYKKTFSGANQNSGITLRDTSEATSAESENFVNLVNNKRIFKNIQNAVNDMQVYTTGFNEKGIKTALAVKDLRLIVANPYHNDMIVDLFAQLLKSDVLTNSFEKPEMLVIPSISVPKNGESVVAFLMHKRAYQFFFKFSFMGSFFDTSNLCINNFLHFWYGKGFLAHLPIVKFTAEVEEVETAG